MKLIKILSILLFLFSCQTTSEEKKAETTTVQNTEVKTKKEISKLQLDSSVLHTDNKYYNLAFQEINQMPLEEVFYPEDQHPIEYKSIKKVAKMPDAELKELIGANRTRLIREYIKNNPDLLS